MSPGHEVGIPRLTFSTSKQTAGSLSRLPGYAAFGQSFCPVGMFCPRARRGIGSTAERSQSKYEVTVKNYVVVRGAQRDRSHPTIAGGDGLQLHPRVGRQSE